MKVLIFCALLLAALAFPAVEGMLPVDAITPAAVAGMKALGCRIDPAGIWKPGEKCLAMAVVNLGGGTGSFVSADGLILTNHQVAFGAVQSFSSPERNYIRDGFLAADRGQEIHAPGYSVRVMTGVDDVTPRFARALRPYPDANRTLRLNYGRVGGYSPRDAVWHSPFTTLAGVLAKNTGRPPFDPGRRFLDAAAAEGRKRHADPARGDVPVNFLTSNDSAGGNSGSPVLNADGELMGVLFDGNHESLVSDFAFRPAITRAIHVDARYVRWVAGEVDGAGSVLRELGLE